MNASVASEISTKIDELVQRLSQAHSLLKRLMNVYIKPDSDEDWSKLAAEAKAVMDATTGDVLLATQISTSGSGVVADGSGHAKVVLTADSSSSGSGAKTTGMRLASVRSVDDAQSPQPSDASVAVLSRMLELFDDKIIARFRTSLPNEESQLTLDKYVSLLRSQHRVINQSNLEMLALEKAKQRAVDELEMLKLDASADDTKPGLLSAQLVSISPSVDDSIVPMADGLRTTAREATHKALATTKTTTMAVRSKDATRISETEDCAIGRKREERRDGAVLPISTPPISSTVRRGVDVFSKVRGILPKKSSAEFGPMTAGVDDLKSMEGTLRMTAVRSTEVATVTSVIEAKLRSMTRLLEESMTDGEATHKALEKLNRFIDDFKSDVVATLQSAAEQLMGERRETAPMPLAVPSSAQCKEATARELGLRKTVDALQSDIRTLESALREAESLYKAKVEEMEATKVATICSLSEQLEEARKLGRRKE